MSNCYVTIFDGTNTSTMDDVLGLNVQYGVVPGGGSILRYLDGSSEKQQRFHKQSIVVSGEDKIPHGLRALDYSQQLDVTVVTGLGTDNYQCYSLGPSETWALKAGQVTWSIVMEEA